MLPSATLQFRRLFDIYYWKTAILIAQNMLGRAYRNSFLGMFWTLLQPFSMVCVYSLIMPMMMRFPQKDYIFMIIAGLPLWTFIASSITSAGNSLLSQGETLKRCIISSTVFPVADVMKTSYVYLIAFTVMYAFASLMAWRFEPMVLLIPLYLIPIVATLMAGAISVAFMAPYVRDVSELLQMGFNVMFWLTPVVYPVAILPEWAQLVQSFNPLFILIQPIQMLAHGGELPSLGMTLRLLVLMMLSIVFAYYIYRKCRRNYVYYL